MPIFGLVLGAAAGFAAVLGRDRRWAVVSGASVAAGVLSFPVIVIGGVTLLALVLLLAQRREAVVGVVLGGLAVALPFTLWLLVVVGISPVAETLRFTLDYQELRPPMRQRGIWAFEAYASNLSQIKYWPMWAAVIIASIPIVSVRARRVRAAAAAAVPVLAAIPGIYTAFNGPAGATFGKLAGVYTTVLSLALLLPVSVWAVQRCRRDISILPALSLPVALLQAPVIAATILRSCWWRSGSCWC